MFICFVLNIIIVPFKSMDKWNQRGLSGGKCVVFIHVIWFLVKYLSDRRVDFFRIEYHSAPRVLSSDNCCFSSNTFLKLIAGYVDSFEDINQHNFESNIMIPEEHCEATSDRSLSFARRTVNVIWYHYTDSFEDLNQHKSQFFQVQFHDPRRALWSKSVA